MEVNAGKRRAAAGRGRRRGRSPPARGTYGGDGQGCPWGGGVGCCAPRIRLGLGPRRPSGRPAGALRVPCVAAARPGGAGRPPPHMAGPREPRARCVYVQQRAGAGWLGRRVTRHYIMGAEAAAAGGDT